MEVLLSLLIAVIFVGAIYLILARNLVRILSGIVMLSNAVNLLIFVCGRIAGYAPPIIKEGQERLSADIVSANPLPQALILTAIVISFALFCFILTLTFRSYEEMGTDEADNIREAEPEENHYIPFKW